MTRSRLLLVALLLGLGTWGLSAWLSGPGGGVGAPGLVRGAGGSSASVRWERSAPSSERLPLAALPSVLREIVQPLEVSRHVTPSAVATTGEWRPTSGEFDLVLAGRVLDPDGEPLAGAVVAMIPDGPTLDAWGYDPPPYKPFFGLGWEGPHRLDYVDLASMPTTLTDEQGDFEILSPSEFDREAPRARAGMTRGLSDPLLVVTSPGFASTTRTVWKYEDGRASLGDVKMGLAAGVTGRVVDVDGEPVAGATVQVEQLSPGGGWGRGPGHADALLPALHTTTSAADGSYTLGGLWAGTTDVGARAPQAAYNRLANLTLTAGEVRRAPDLVLGPGGRIAGVVVDVDGQPVGGVRVLATERPRDTGGHGCVVESYEPEDDTAVLELEVASEWRTLKTHTDGAGRFELVGVPDADITLYASGRGWEPTRLSDVEVGSLGLQLELRREASFHLTLLAGLETVGDAPPVLDATLRALRLSGVMGEDTPLDVVSASDGYIVHGVGPLGTRLELSAPGRATTSVELPGVSAAEHEAFTVRLGPAHRVQGRVTTAAGDAWSGGVVRLKQPGSSNWNALAWRRTDAAGEFEMTRLPAGEYTLEVGEAPRFVLSRKVVLTAGRTDELTLSLDVVMPTPSRIMGRLLSASGEVLPNQSLSLQFPDLKTKLSARTDETGHFAFQRLSSGSHLLKVGRSGRLVVHVAQGETQDVELQLKPEPVVRGVVRYLGEPVVGVIVSCEGARFRKAVTDEAGAYSLAFLEPGAGYVTYQPPGGRQLTGPHVALDWGDLRTEDLSVPGGRIDGRVLERSAGGEPVANLELKLMTWGTSDDREQLATTQTDAAGHYSFAYLPAGDYWVEKDRDADRWLPFEPLAVRLSTGDVVHAPEVKLRRGATITGTVVLPSGVPDSSRRLKVRVRRVGVADPERSQRLVRVENGRFAFHALEDGAYRVLALGAFEDDEDHEPDAGVVVDVVEGTPLEVRLEAEEDR